MSARVFRIGLFFVLGVGLLAGIAWYRLGDRWGLEDQFPPPPFPIIGENAQPQLLSAVPLPSLHRTAKPVVAADHEGQVVVIAQDLTPPASTVIAWWTSQDRGQSWDEAKLFEDTSPEFFSFDPWLATDRRGRFYSQFVRGKNFRVGEWEPLTFLRSLDGGQSWSPSPDPPQPGDRPVFSISPNGKILVSASAMSERTADAPAEPLNGDEPQLQEKINASIRNFSGIFVSRDRGGSWKQLPGPLGDTHAACFSVVVEDDGRIACSWVVAGDGSRSVVCSTRDQGQNWTETELVASLQPDRDHPFSGERFPVLAVDGNNNLHVAFIRDQGKELVVRSSNNWNDWQSPIQLSSNDVYEARMPAIAAWGPMVHITWMERSNDSNWQAYYRGSRDHGETWSDKILLSVPHPGSQLISKYGFEITSDLDQTSVTDDGLGNAHAVWSVQGYESATTGTVWHAVVHWTQNAEPSKVEQDGPPNQE